MNFLEVINKGVPISTPLTIILNDLCELSNNKARTKKKISNEFEKYVDFLNSKAEPNDIELFMTLCILSDSETLEKKLHFAPGGFVSSLLYNLNVDNICKKNNTSFETTTIESFKEEYEEKLNSRIDELKNIISEKTLKRQYPMLYEKYKIYEDYYNSIKKVKNIIEDPNKSFVERMKVRGDLYRMYKEQGEDVNIDELFEKTENFNLKSFCNSYAKTFKGLVDNMDEIIDYLFNNPLNINSLDIDSEKLELYVANNSMFTCEDGNISDKQRFIYYVANYFASNKERKTMSSPKIRVGIEENDSLKVKKNGIEITPRSLYERYRLFLKEHPEIKIIDLSKINFEGMNLEQAEIFLYEYLKDLQANWDILPEEELDRDIARSIQKSQTITEEDKLKHQERLMDLLVEKKELYGSTDPFFRIKGKDTFDGYIGFIYHNGKVILDKFYENAEEGKLADGEAIYVMNMEDFYRLSQFPKSVLIKDPRVDRIIHAGAWQDRVLDVISKNNSTKEATDKEVKRLLKENKIEE